MQHQHPTQNNSKSVSNSKPVISAIDTWAIDTKKHTKQKLANLE